MTDQRRKDADQLRKEAMERRRAIDRRRKAAEVRAHEAERGRGGESGRGTDRKKTAQDSQRGPGARSAVQGNAARRNNQNGSARRESGAEQQRNYSERAQKRAHRKRQDRSPLFWIIRIWSLVFAAVLVWTGKTVFTFGVLPGKWMAGILAAVAVVGVLLFIPMFFRAFKRSRRLISFVLSLLIAFTGVYAVRNMDKTTQFLSSVTTDVTTQTQEYYVVVNKDSDYVTVTDLDGSDVLAYSKASSGDAAARKKLEKNADVTFLYKPSLSKIGKKLEDDNESAALLSAGHYEGISEKDKSFKGKTRVIEKIKVRASADLSKNVSVTNTPFNIYLSGLDTAGTIDTVSRSDVNMIVTVNPRTHTILLTSIPRDYIVKLTEKDNAEDKLTHTGIYGIQQTMESVEDLTGLDMNYYIKVNYSTVSRVINAIGGVDVYSDQAFVTHGQRYFTFKKGKNHLNGARALAFARERHAFEDGDLQRNRDQAKVVEAMIKKVSSSKTLLTHYASILDSCKNYMQINMSQQEISSLIRMQLNGGYHWTIKKQGMDGKGEFTQCYSTGNYQVYAMRPDEKSVEKAVNKIMSLEEAR